jgi:hypothetical protein
MGEFASLLESLTVRPGCLIIVGNFNFHVDDCSDVSAVNFQKKFLLDFYNFSLDYHLSKSIKINLL